MRKITGLVIAGAIAGVGFSACGTKYTPLTEEQKAAKADSVFAATVDVLKAEKAAVCENEFQARVEQKVAELSATASK